MGVLSTAISLTGLLFLTHAVYSSYEHSLTHAAVGPTTTSSDAAPYRLPTDIILETLLSTALLCAGIVLGSPALRPIAWSVWASEASLDDRRAPGKRSFEQTGDGGMVGNPFRFLENGERRGFVDVIGKRQEFANWVRDKNGAPVLKS